MHLSWIKSYKGVKLENTSKKQFYLAIKMHLKLEHPTSMWVNFAVREQISYSIEDIVQKTFKQVLRNF